MREHELPEIRALELFDSMGNESFAQLMQAAYLQTFPAQVQLIAEGDPADFLFILIEGGVELVGSNAGRETTMAIIRPFGTFILAAVLKDATHLMSARTTEKSRVLIIPARNVRDILAADDAFARAIVVELAGCYRAVVRDQKNSNCALRWSDWQTASSACTRRRAQQAISPCPMTRRPSRRCST